MNVTAAMQANLDMVVDAATAVGVDCWLIRTVDARRHRVAVRLDGRAALAAELLRRAQNDTIHVRFRTRRDVMLRSRRHARVLAGQPMWTVYRAYAAPRTTWALGPEHGCDVEFWATGPDGFVAHESDRIDGERVPYELAKRVVVRIAERDYPSFEAIVDRADAYQVTFPVDVVYTWVDGSDPWWQRRKGEHLTHRNGTAAVSADSAQASRFLTRDELRYSLRSLWSFADWIRHVYIVTDRQVPSWLDPAHPRITIVDHRDIFEEPVKLPTFNSHAIESQLHRIDGLADRYLYLNDDVFFGRFVPPDLFFHPNGLSKFFLSPKQIGTAQPTASEPTVMSAAKNGRLLIEQKFDLAVNHKLKHTPHPQIRAVLEEMADVFGEAFEATSSSRFRGVDDISPAASLHHHYAYATGRAVPGTLDYLYVDTTRGDLRQRLTRIERTRAYDVFCINDTTATDRDLAATGPLVQRFLARYFPWPSPFERA